MLIKKITRVPTSQFYFLGVINLRGEVIPVMSIRRKMGLEDDVYTLLPVYFNLSKNPPYTITAIICLLSA